VLCSVAARYFSLQDTTSLWGAEKIWNTTWEKNVENIARKSLKNVLICNIINEEVTGQIRGTK
jgi:hypothetical protein